MRGVKTGEQRLCDTQPAIEPQKPDWAKSTTEKPVDTAKAELLLREWDKTCEPFRRLRNRSSSVMKPHYSYSTESRCWNANW